MKKVYFFLSMLTSVSYAQDCSKIFISEYVEGWSNNKALEIYNPTGNAVNLSQYFVARFSNGSNTATNANAVQLSGTIQPYSVYVAVIDKRDQLGTDQEAPIWDSLEVKGDGFYCSNYNTSNAFYWNGNDAVMLAKGTLTGPSSNSITTALGYQIIDIIGKIGENPANETGSTANNNGAWSTTFPYNAGQGVLITKDHSMIRKASVKKGVTANPSFFNPLAEYDSIPAVTYVVDQNGDTIVGSNGPILFGNWFSLGNHTCDCYLSKEEVTQKEVELYPNPSTDGMVYAKNTETVKLVEVYNSLGQKTNAINNNASMYMSIQLGKDKGVYLVRFVYENGVSSTKRMVIK